MRSLLLIIALLLVILSFTACEEFLRDEPESVLGQANFFTTPARINQGILGCYAGMKSIMNTEWMLTELRSDNTCVSATTSSSSRRQALTNIAHFALLPSEVDVQDYWYNTFQNISNINAVLPSVLDNSYVTIEDDRAQYEAELRFMRAYHYFTLVNLFGDMFKVTTVIGPDDAKAIVRSPVVEIYNDIIIPDLKIAAENAPDSYTVKILAGLQNGQQKVCWQKRMYKWEGRKTLLLLNRCWRRLSMKEALGWQLILPIFLIPQKRCPEMCVRRYFFRFATEEGTLRMVLSSGEFCTSIL